MPWLESHTEIIRHRKTISTAAQLNIKPVHLVGHLHALWHTALEQQPDGDLSKWTPEFIAQSAMWDGDHGQFEDSLRQNGWIDETGLIHGWLQYVGRYLKSSRYKRQPEEWQRIIELHNTVHRQSTDSPQTVHRLSPLHNQHNQHNQPTEQKVGGDGQVNVTTTAVERQSIGSPSVGQRQEGAGEWPSTQELIAGAYSAFPHVRKPARESNLLEGYAAKLCSNQVVTREDWKKLCEFVKGHLGEPGVPQSPTTLLDPDKTAQWQTKMIAPPRDTFGRPIVANDENADKATRAKVAATAELYEQ